jgi:hypothetical protein
MVIRLATGSATCLVTTCSAAGLRSSTSEVTSPWNAAASVSVAILSTSGLPTTNWQSVLSSGATDRVDCGHPSHQRRSCRQEGRDLFYPAKHFVMPEDRIKGRWLTSAKNSKSGSRNSKARASSSRRSGFPLEQIRHRDAHLRPASAPALKTTHGRSPAGLPGSTPDTLFNYFPEDFLFFVDESHVTVPQVRGMYAGDRSRKLTLVDHGFRLPCALDNRPLMFDEFEKKLQPDGLCLGHTRGLGT